MKKYLTLFVGISFALLSSSCKKDFVCECTSTSSSSTSAYVSETTIKDSRKTHAQARCTTTEQTSTDWNGQTVTYTSTCELK